MAEKKSLHKILGKIGRTSQSSAGTLKSGSSSQTQDKFIESDLEAWQDFMENDASAIQSASRDSKEERDETWQLGSIVINHKVKQFISATLDELNGYLENKPRPGSINAKLAGVYKDVVAADDRYYRALFA